MWSAMTGRYGLWNCPPATLKGFLQDMLKACSQVLTQCLDDMPRESMLWVDFEELRTDPKQTLQKVLRFLRPTPAIEDVTVVARLDEALRQVPIHDGARASMPDDESARKFEMIVAAARSRFGHPR